MNNKNKGYRTAITVLMALGSQISTAGTMGTPPPSVSFVAALSAGPAWPTNVGRNQTFFLTPEIEKSYIASNRSTQTIADGEIFLGVQAGLPYSLTGQFGVAAATTSEVGLSGIIWDDALPEFDNYSYKYKVRHTHVALKGKLLWDRGYWVTPWIGGSVAVGFNQSTDFENMPLIPEAVVTPNFANHMTTAFSYTAGAGIQRTISDNVQVGVGYEFSDWGNSNLGRAEGQTSRRGLTLNHVYTNALMFTISCTAPL
jgi:opacity protein-like surface antigen